MADQPLLVADKVRAWDGPTRVFHWIFVVLVLSAWFAYRYGEAIWPGQALRWHSWNGYAILVLLVWRVLWGFAGSSTSRFSAFVRWPWTAAGYGLDVLRRRKVYYLGHNPLGTYMILALLAALAIQATLGLVSAEPDNFVSGPLSHIVSEPVSQTLTRWHRWWFYWIVLPLAAIHTTINIVYEFVLREPLIRAMVTGHKPREDYADAAEAAIVAHPFVRAFICLLAAGTMVFGTMIALGAKF